MKYFVKAILLIENKLKNYYIKQILSKPNVTSLNVFKGSNVRGSNTYVGKLDS